ncbi:MAG: flagellar FlbD family protein [Planctomycetota bacterium]|nr:flagellar FlbD family protein [Planctomycetota bacterium]
MIRLTRLNGKEFFLNAELIKFVEQTPDTVVTLISGEKVIVAETADGVVDRVIEFGKRLRVFSMD